MRAVAVLTLALLAGGCDHVSRLGLSPGRDAWQRPDLVIAALAIEPGQRVADVGAGEGYFVPHLLDAVGTQGVVYAVEVDDPLVAGLEQRFRADERVVVVRGQFDDPALPDAGVDLVLLINVFHHIGAQGRVAYFQRLAADLAAGGRVAIVELNPEVGGVLGLFAPEDHATPRDVLIAELEQAGWRHVGSHDVLPIQNLELFAR
jgi:predicted methyltransferase